MFICKLFLPKAGEDIFVMLPLFVSIIIMNKSSEPGPRIVNKSLLGLSVPFIEEYLVRKRGELVWNFRRRNLFLLFEFRIKIKLDESQNVAV